MRNRLASAVIVLAVLGSSGALAALAAPALPATPAAVQDLLYARPFRLAEPVSFPSYPEAGTISHGLLVVLVAEPALCFARQSEMPTLMVDDKPVLRFNVGFPSGVVVGLVPGDVDLRTAVLWFGMPTALSRTAALAAGLAPLTAETIRRATEAGGPGLAVPDYLALARAAQTLVARFAADTPRQR